jgi:hypothetical protein
MEASMTEKGVRLVGGWVAAWDKYKYVWRDSLAVGLVLAGYGNNSKPKF